MENFASADAMGILHLAQAERGTDVIMQNEFLLQILKFQFIAYSHTLTEHVKHNLKNSSFCLPVYLI